MQSGTDCVFGKSKNHNKHTETICLINPYLANGFSHHYQLDESTFVSRDFYLIFHLSLRVRLWPCKTG